MCGIVSYIGERDLVSILLVGLERLSYRGYDSSGISVLSNGELGCWKAPGKIRKLENKLKPLSIKGSAGIGHTRWATHGEPNEINAHPHISANKKIAVVHNGIIENYSDIKKKLEKEGAIFRSQSDTEVIPYLLEKYYEGDFLVAIHKTLSELEGAYSISIITEYDPDKIFVAKNGSPLIVGLGKNENFVSSDINSIIHHTRDVVYLEDKQYGVISKDEFQVFNGNHQKQDYKINTIDWDSSIQDKSGYDHYMIKEIAEQPAVVRKIISKYINQNGDISFPNMNFDNEFLAHLNRFIIQACGTSWHAGLIGKFLFEKYARILTEVDISSEFRYRQMLSAGKEVLIALSQSGETADTLACIHEAKSKFFKILSFVNVKNSSMDRESDSVIYSHAGQEVGVASTKNFIAQLISIYIFSLHLGKIKWTIQESEVQSMLKNLNMLPGYIEKIISNSESIRKIAVKYAQSKDFIFIGRGINYPVALEGALKLKEISYIHATGYPAGELKHGPIALIDKNMPVVCLAPSNSVTYQKMISNIQEIRARKGKTIVIATEGDTNIENYADDVIYIPEIIEDLTPVLMTIPLQLMAYYIALELECDVDQPRNLAKSVTVE